MVKFRVKMCKNEIKLKRMKNQFSDFYFLVDFLLEIHQESDQFLVKKKPNLKN